MFTKTKYFRNPALARWEERQNVYDVWEQRMQLTPTYTQVKSTRSTQSKDIRCYLRVKEVTLNEHPGNGCHSGIQLKSHHHLTCPVLQSWQSFWNCQVRKVTGKLPFSYHSAVVPHMVKKKWFCDDDHHDGSREEREHQLNLERNPLTAKWSVDSNSGFLHFWHTRLHRLPKQFQ